MIDVVRGQPSDEEVAAIVAAVSHHERLGVIVRVAPQGREVEGRRAGAWTIAGRHPELEIEELRAAARSNRVF